MPPKKQTVKPAATFSANDNILLDLEENFGSFKQVFELISYGNAQILRMVKKFQSIFSMGKLAQKDLIILSKFKNIASKLSSGSGFSEIVITSDTLKKIASMFNYDVSTQTYLLVLFYSMSKMSGSSVTYSKATMQVGNTVNQKVVPLGHYYNMGPTGSISDFKLRDVFKGVEFKDMFNETSYASRITFRRIYNFYKTFIPSLASMSYDDWTDQVTKIVDTKDETGLDTLVKELEKNPSNELFFVLLLIISVHLTFALMVKAYLHNAVLYFQTLLAANIKDFSTLDDSDKVLAYTKGLLEKYGKHMNLKTFGFASKNNATLETIAELLDVLENKAKFEDLIAKSVTDGELKDMDSFISRLFLIYN